MSEDWYKFFTGRPGPGRRAPTPASRYLDDAHDDGVVYGPGAVVARPDGVVEGADTAPRRTRGRTEAARGGLPGTPRWAGDAVESRVRGQQRNLAGAPDYPVGPGGVVESEYAAERVPFSALSGRDQRPFGQDFVTWYEATRGRPLPQALRAETVPEAPEIENPGRAPSNSNNIPRGIEGGDVVVATRVERGVNDRAPTQRITLPPIEGDQWDEDRQAGIRPPDDFWTEWRGAEERAFERQRARQPTIYDMVFLAVFGHRGEAKPDGAKQLMNAGQVADQVSARQRQERETDQEERTEYRDPVSGDVVLVTAEERRRREQAEREDRERIGRRQGLRVTGRGVEYRRRF